MHEKAILNGSWLPTNQGIGVTSEGVLADGQHRLQAIKNLGYLPVTLLLVTGLDPKVYRIIDIGRKRSMFDSVKLDRPLMREEVVATRTLANIKFNNDWWVMRQPPDRADASQIIKWIDAYEDGYGLFASSVNRQSFFRAGVRAALLVYAVTHPASAADLIRMVEHGEDLKQTMPAYHLRLLLQRPPLAGARGTCEDFGCAVRCINDHQLRVPMRLWRSNMACDWCMQIKERMPHVDTD